ncbi:sulfotransferase domain-containing protein [Candidatus Pelagibacter sp.]|nr:sulfotransferase domain-containing protein [Candidatus Pelagibacter sp.]
MIIWLASYPKSGNTWLRSLLATYYFSRDGLFNFDILRNIDQFPSSTYFKKYKDLFLKPESTSKYWILEQKRINQNKKLKFFKTHNALCKIDNNSFTNSENTLGAIYIIRDPRKVVSSLAHHYQVDNDQAFKFMQTEKNAIYQKEDNRYLGFNALFSWKFHTLSWIECKKFPVLTIRYEDLENETFLTFKKVFNFINDITKSKKSFDREKAKKTIRSCEFKKMQKLELENGFEEAMIKKDTNERIKFFNLGKKNNYKELLDSKLIDKMNFSFQDQIEKYYDK